METTKFHLIQTITKIHISLCYCLFEKLIRKIKLLLRIMKYTKNIMTTQQHIITTRQHDINISCYYYFRIQLMIIVFFFLHFIARS